MPGLGLGILHNHLLNKQINKILVSMDVLSLTMSVAFLLSRHCRGAGSARQLCSCNNSCRRAASFAS